MISLSIFDDDGQLGLPRAFDETFQPFEYGGGWEGGISPKYPKDIFSEPFVEPIGGGPYYNPPFENVGDLPAPVQPASTPVQTVGTTGTPAANPPSQTSATGTATPEPSANQPAETVAGIDSNLLLIGGAVLVAVLILK